MQPHVVAVAVLPKAPIFELAVPSEIFGIPRPDLASPWYELRLCALQRGSTAVAGGFTVDTPYGFDDLYAADTIIVPACADVHADPPRELIEALQHAADRGARIAAICSGAFILAAAGLLNERRATTHWMHAAELTRRYPRVIVDASVLFVQEDSIFTSAGTAAGLDLCLELVRRDHGAALASRLARRLVIPAQRDGGQAQFIELPTPADGQALAALQDWMIEHLDRPLTLAEIARAGHVSTRTLARRFTNTLHTSPVRWLLNQRIRRAQELLESTDESIEHIAQLSGFGSAASLRQHFARTVGVRPQTYRQAFGSRQARSKGHDGNGRHR